MKRLINLRLGIWILVGAICVGCVAACFIFSRSERQQSVDWERITEAVHAFAQDHAVRGVALPDSVSLRELAGYGLLQADDLVAFGRAEVHIYLKADESRPSKLMMEARLPDGSRVAVLADGSALQVPK